jgi:hypothetical protein
MIYDQGVNGACALFPSWRRHFLEKMDSDAVLVVFGPMLQGIDHCSGTFLFCNFSNFFWPLSSILLLGRFVVAEVECNWYLLDINI